MTLANRVREFRINKPDCYNCRDCSEQHPEAFMRVFNVIAPLGIDERPSDAYIQQVESSCPYNAIRYTES